MRTERVIVHFAMAAYVAASLTYAAHGLDTNPQYDNQGLTYAAEMIEDIRDGRLWSFLMQERKYPMAHVLPYAAAKGIVLVFKDGITKQESFVIGRVLAMLFSFGRFAVVWRIAKRLDASREATLLLMASSAQTTPGWDEPRLLDLATHRATFPNARLRLDADAPENWPERLPARSLVFIPPELYSSIEFGTLETMRDGRANPVLHIWAAQE